MTATTTTTTRTRAGELHSKLSYCKRGFGSGAAESN